MKVIVITANRQHRTRTLQTSGLRLMLGTAVLSLVLLGIGGGTVYTGLKISGSALLTSEGLKNWKTTINNQQQALALVKQDTERQLDALTVRLAELQSRITRLDALGERLTVKAKLDDGEFDFSEPVIALGGPEQPLLEGLDGSGKRMLLKDIDQLAEQIDRREQQLDLLDSLLNSRTLYQEAFVMGLPVEKGWLSSRFGRRIDPFTNKPAWHNGVDFAGKIGANIIAVAAGIVTWVGNRNNYGLLVEINHGNGYITRYAHNSALAVKVGDIVHRGQVIAAMGSSGRSTGAHVHFEVWHEGIAVDPGKYIYRASQ